mmetsp:Transcript_9366/g.8861  ORF Transcript_9366/g.8861 Transcript_9366/m.8861 type:complete len:224 (-) Transcript_9366:3045-3716(-)
MFAFKASVAFLIRVTSLAAWSTVLAEITIIFSFISSFYMTSYYLTSHCTLVIMITRCTCLAYELSIFNFAFITVSRAGITSLSEHFCKIHAVSLLAVIAASEFITFVAVSDGTILTLSGFRVIEFTNSTRLSLHSALINTHIVTLCKLVRLTIKAEGGVLASSTVPGTIHTHLSFGAEEFSYFTIQYIYALSGIFVSIEAIITEDTVIHIFIISAFLAVIRTT